MRSAGLDRPVESGVHRPLPCAPQVNNGTGDALSESIEVTVPGIGPLVVSPQSPLPPKYRPILPTDARQKFWLARETWPRDAAGKVFLARAVDTVGKAMFDEWSGWEPTVDLSLRLLPTYKLNVPDWEIKAAMDRLPPMTEDDRRIVEERLSGKGSSEEFSALMARRWELAVALRAETINEIQPIRDRMLAVYRWLESAMLEGRLSYYLRFDETGMFSTAMPPHWWNGEHGSARFYMCRMNPLMPITPSVGGNGFRLIFVDEAELQSLVANVRPLAQKNLISEQKKFERWLDEHVKASPTKRTLEHNRDIKPWLEKNAPSLTVRTVREIRAIVLENNPGNTWGE